MALIHFLLVYDRVRGVLAMEPAEYEDASTAAEAYEQAEWEYRLNSDIEIVLIGADSIETVRQTHRNYFAGDEVPFAGVAQ